MEHFLVRGGRKLEGSIRVQGAKNAVLPILAAAILTEERVQLEGVPDLADVRAMLGILEKLGCCAEMEKDQIRVDSANIRESRMPEKLSKQIRSSIFLLGPILARLRRAEVPYPGGCEIGLRPIDLHLKGLRMLGVSIREKDGYLLCDGGRMQSGDVYLDYPSVGATENVMMAAVLLPGVTTLHNAAREPEIEDLQQFMNRMGARVSGAGSQVIRIEGVEKLHGITYRPIPDRIVAGTLLCAGAITGGSVFCHDARYRDLVPVVMKLREMGCQVQWNDEGIYLKAPERLRAFSEVQTQPHPGFPTDMQSQMVALASVARGCALVTENVFENRFGHVGDLCLMGANIRVMGRTAVIQGVDALHGGCVRARDLRGGAALVLSALAARGETRVEGAHLVDRGYDHLEQMLHALGADIVRGAEG